MPHHWQSGTESAKLFALEDEWPTYQYRCTECGNDLEAVQKFTDDALTVCPSCGGQLRKVYNAVGVVFKGSGFYRNDSRGSEPSSASTSSNGTGTTGDSAGSSSSSSDGGSSSSGGSEKSTSTEKAASSGSSGDSGSSGGSAKKADASKGSSGASKSGGSSAA